MKKTSLNILKTFNECHLIWCGMKLEYTFKWTCNKKRSLTNCTLFNLQTFDDLLELAEQGDHREVDMLVKDIYGGAYSSIGLSGDIIASSFGKAARSPKKSGV